MSPDLEDDYATASSDDIEASCEMFDKVVDGGFYQREVDAMRSMGWNASAEKLKRQLAEQGIAIQ